MFIKMLVFFVMTITLYSLFAHFFVHMIMMVISMCFGSNYDRLNLTFEESFSMIRMIG